MTERLLYKLRSGRLTLPSACCAHLGAMRASLTIMGYSIASIRPNSAMPANAQRHPRC